MQERLTFLFVFNSKERARLAYDEIKVKAMNVLSELWITSFSDSRLTIEGYKGPYEHRYIFKVVDAKCHNICGLKAHDVVFDEAATFTEEQIALINSRKVIDS